MKIYKYKDKQFYSEKSLRNYFKEHEKVLFGVSIPLNEWGISVEYNNPTTEVSSDTYDIRAEQSKRYVETSEDKAKRIRCRRDAYLSKTDKYMLSDYPISEEGRKTIVEYREYLRNITKAEGFPDDITVKEIPDVS
jgi:Phage tail assembly chaperone protein